MKRRFGPATLLLAVLVPASPALASSSLVEELRALHAHYDADPARLDAVRRGLEELVVKDPAVENLLALAQVSFICGDVRATTRDQKLQTYGRGREAAQRARELDPQNALAHFWFAANSGRLGQTRGILTSLFGLSGVKEAIRTALELDPNLTAVYVVAGYVYLEVPGIFGGDLRVAENLFRKGLAQDPRFTGMRVGLAKTLIRKARYEEARRELHTVLEERAPSNPADWAFRDRKEARELLEAIAHEN